METENQVPSTLVSVKRVREDKGKGQKKDQDQLVLTFGLDQEGNNSLDALIDALTPYRGKQVNFDIRITEKQSGTTKFKTAFVLVKEMIPRGAAQGRATYVPKESKQDQIRQQASKFANGIE